MSFFFSSRRRHTRCGRDWSSDVCSSDLLRQLLDAGMPVDEPNRWGRTAACRHPAADEGCRYARPQPGLPGYRSEERRVGKEGGAQGAPEHEKKNEREGV